MFTGKGSLDQSEPHPFSSPSPLLTANMAASPPLSWQVRDNYLETYGVISTRYFLSFTIINNFLDIYPDFKDYFVLRKWFS